MTDDAAFDGRETITLDFEKENLYQLMLLAHKFDMTLNDFIEMALVQYIEKHKNELGTD